MNSRNNKKVIGLFSNDAFSMYHFRKDLITSLIKKDYTVILIIPPDKIYVKKLELLGTQVVVVRMSRFLSPLKDVILIINLFSIFKKLKIDILHNMTIKPNIYGSIIARSVGIKKIVCLVSGAGFLFSDQSSALIEILKKPIKFIYKLSFRACHKVWFQNPDDLELFINQNLIIREKCVCIRSGGINIEEYNPDVIKFDDLKYIKNEFGLKKDKNIVLLVAARRIWSKGVKEFIEAAKIIAQQNKSVYFIMICPDESSPDRVPNAYIENNKFKRLIVVDKFRTDIKNFISLCDILVLPSYYREGIPRVLLEGLAMAKPIITTDHIGCKEVVDNKKNGFLIPIKNSQQLAEKISFLLKNSDKRLSFGSHSRDKAIHEFSSEIIIKKIFNQLYN